MIMSVVLANTDVIAHTPKVFVAYLTFDLLIVIVIESACMCSTTQKMRFSGICPKINKLLGWCIQGVRSPYA